MPTNEEVVSLLRDLVSIESVNPSFGSGSGEAAAARYVADFARNLSLDVEIQDVAPGRPNVLVHFGSRQGGVRQASSLGNRSSSFRVPRLLWQSHLDTVQVTGMTIDPFAGKVENGRLYGRGACDAKAQLVTMMLALKQLVERKAELPCEILFAACVDEEFHFQGVTHLVESGVQADAAIVGEPTALEIVLAHKGFIRFEVEVLGKAAHSSTPENGVNAVCAMTRVIRHLTDDVIPTYRSAGHPLVGPPTLCVSLIQGGAGINTVPERCVIGIDRRLIPGEEPMRVWEQLKASIEGLAAEVAPATIHVREPFLRDWAMETNADQPIAQTLRSAVRDVLGRQTSLVGVPYGCDASKLARAGIPTVVFGPGSIAQAHAKDEWVEIAQIVQAAEILVSLAMRFGA